MVMQASDKLNRLKNKVEINSRVDDLTKIIFYLKNDIDNIKNEMRESKKHCLNKYQNYILIAKN